MGKKSPVLCRSYHDCYGNLIRASDPIDILFKVRDTFTLQVSLVWVSGYYVADLERDISCADVVKYNPEFRARLIKEIPYRAADPMGRILFAMPEKVQAHQENSVPFDVAFAPSVPVKSIFMKRGGDSAIALNE